MSVRSRKFSPPDTTSMSIKDTRNDRGMFDDSPRPSNRSRLYQNESYGELYTPSKVNFDAYLAHRRYETLDKIWDDDIFSTYRTHPALRSGTFRSPYSPTAPPFVQGTYFNIIPCSLPF